MDKRLRVFFIRAKEGALERIYPFCRELSLYPGLRDLREQLYRKCREYYQLYVPQVFLHGHFLLINGDFCMHPERVYHTEHPEDLEMFQKAFDEGLIEVARERDIPAWLAEFVKQSGRRHLDAISERVGINRKLHLLQRASQIK